MKLSGLELTEDELKAMVDSANQNLTRYEEMRADSHSQRRVAAVSLQRARAGHRSEQDEAAVPLERGAGA